MKCPRDGSPLNTEKYEAKVEVDSCPACHGVWLDKGELEQIQETIERDYTQELEVRPDRVAASIDEARRRSIDCPKCGTRLETEEYAYCSSVFVDVCPDGCGMWLDEGELQELEKFFEREQKTTVTEQIEYLWVSLLSVFHRPKKPS
jgi:Zn-finger nucleic acid-binding protein